MPPFMPELISDILLRLPAKSLLRFRCLSTSFCAEIDSSDFAKNHLKRLMETKSGRKLIISSSVHFYASDFDDRLRKVIKFNYPLRDQSLHSLYICGAAAGLILLILNSGFETVKLILWNPTTRRCKKLPACSAITRPYDFRTCGLGYDSAADDYRVVMFSYVSNKDNYNRTVQVWIFSSKSNSWRWSQDLPLDSVNCIERHPAGFVNGALYWQHNLEHQVFGFDIANEKLFTFPDFCLFQVQDGLMSRHFLTALESEGYVLGSQRREEFQDFHLFVSEDGGRRGEGNWRKAAFRYKWKEPIKVGEMVYLNLMPVCVKPLAYSKEGDCLLIQHYEDFYWYNFKKETRKKVELMGLPCPLYACYSFVCFESLVSLDDDGTFPVQ